jgi:hypothetical protein
VIAKNREHHVIVSIAIFFQVKILHNSIIHFVRKDVRILTRSVYFTFPNLGNFFRCASRRFEESLSSDRTMCYAHTAGHHLPAYQYPLKRQYLSPKRLCIYTFQLLSLTVMIYAVWAIKHNVSVETLQLATREGRTLLGFSTSQLERRIMRIGGLERVRECVRGRAFERLWF